MDYKGVKVFDDPIDFEPGPMSLVLGGRTSTANAYHHIDNVSVKTVEDIEHCDIPHPYFSPGGPSVIGSMVLEGVLENAVFGPLESGIPGWTAYLASDAGTTIDNHTIAEEVLDAFIGNGNAIVASYDEVDLAGGGGSFPQNYPYPNGVTDTSMSDFAVRVLADVIIPAGTYTIGFGSDDGGKVQIEGIQFDQTLNSDDVERNEIRFEENRGHQWTVGTFTVDEDLETQILGSFHERGGGDSFEIAVIEGEVLEAASPATGWELLADGVLGWSLTSTRRRMLSADLKAVSRSGRPFEFDVNGDTGEADQLVVENPDPEVFTTYLDIDGLSIQIKGVGTFAAGDRFAIFDADQITGTLEFWSANQLIWDFDATTGEVCFDTCTIAGDYNSDGVLDAGDIDLQTKAMSVPNPVLMTFDENQDGLVDATDRLIWVHDYAMTWMGDANLDGEFNGGDLVAVFVAGKYVVDPDTAETATWAEGDWNGDMFFDSGDLVVAFEDGGYVTGAVPAVPEPMSVMMLVTGVIGIARVLKTRRSRV